MQFKSVRSIFLLLIIVFIAFDNSNAQFNLVQTQNGTVSGLHHDNVSIFKGIPFAAPPVGDLRWKAPQPATNWTGVRKCEQFSASPLQSTPAPFQMWTEEFLPPIEPLSEDCLYLNVWTAAKSRTEKIPVFVWVYGGGFVAGSSSCAIYDGEEFAKKGVVFVSINYRLGVFGFLAHPALSRESEKNTSGNYALLDQIAALQWIQKNIAAFGGDPGNVTIAGQSAGSISINALVASSLSKGLFHKAIAQSGAFVTSTTTKKLQEAEQVGESFMVKANVTTVAALRSMPAAEIYAISQRFPYRSFAPVFDNYVLPVDPLSYFRQGKHNDVPLLTGWVTGDGALSNNQGSSAEKFKDEARNKYGNRSEEFLKLFPANSDEEARVSQAKLALCLFTGLPSHVWAHANKSKTYIYQFGFVPTDKPGFPNYGSFHSAELGYALHTLNKWNRPWQQRDYALEKIMSSYWVNFAKTGNPNGIDLPEWKPYETATQIILELNDKIVSRPGLLKKEFAFLEQTLKQP